MSPRESGGPGAAIELGPVERIGARGRMQSIDIRDPDLNLVEIARYDHLSLRA